MSSNYKISLPTAIILNMNIMLGVGLFVNTVSLAKMAGILSPLIYLFVAFLMLPLVLSIAKLLKIHPGGNFYDFGNREINPLIGFIAAWSYFVSKMASAALMIHFAVLIMQNSFSALKNLPPLGLDLAILGLFAWLNLKNMRTGSKIQYTFMVLKIIPVLFIIITGLICFDLVNIDTNIAWQTIPLSIPLIIYAFSGFEASCSLSAHIENAEKNAPKAILSAFFMIATISALYQFMFYGSVGASLGQLSHYFEIFTVIIQKVFSASNSWGHKIQAILQLAIATSSLGGSYGIMFSNSWNLHALAKAKHLFGSSKILKLNAHGVPVFCILAEALIGMIYLVATKGNNIPLQQIGAFGCTLAYTFCVIALFANSLKQAHKRALILPSLGLISCALLLGSCLNGFIKNATYSPLALFGLLGLGLMMFFWSNRQKD